MAVEEFCEVNLNKMKVFMIVVTLLSSWPGQTQTLESSNRHFWYSLTTAAKPQAVWQIWTDVSNWQQWDIGLQEAEIEGAFTEGTKGRVLSLEGRWSKFRIVECQPSKSYTLRMRLPLGSLWLKRYLSDEGEGEIRITHEVWFQGLSKGIFARIFGERFRSMLPEVVKKVKYIAEQNKP